MLVLGIDPGTAITGYGLVNEKVDGQYEVIDFGVIRTDAKQAQAERLVSLYNQINQILLLHSPGSCAVEKLFFQKNVKTATVVGEARGVIMLALAEHKLKPAEYSPNEIKQAVCGYGKADKNQVQHMVQILLSLPELPQPDDAADALAVAICHLNHSRFNAAVKQAADKS